MTPIESLRTGLEDSCQRRDYIEISRRIQKLVDAGEEPREICRILDDWLCTEDILELIEPARKADLQLENKTDWPVVLQQLVYGTEKDLNKFITAEDDLESLVRILDARPTVVALQRSRGMFRQVYLPEVYALTELAAQFKKVLESPESADLAGALRRHKIPFSYTSSAFDEVVTALKQSSTEDLADAICDFAKRSKMTAASKARLVAAAIGTEDFEQNKDLVQQLIRELKVKPEAVATAALKQAGWYFRPRKDRFDQFFDCFIEKQATWTLSSAVKMLTAGPTASVRREAAEWLARETKTRADKIACLHSIDANTPSVGKLVDAIRLLVQNGLIDDFDIIEVLSISSTATVACRAALEWIRRQPEIEISLAREALTYVYAMLGSDVNEPIEKLYLYLSTLPGVESLIPRLQMMWPGTVTEAQEWRSFVQERPGGHRLAQRLFFEYGESPVPWLGRIAENTFEELMTACLDGEFSIDTLNDYFKDAAKGKNIDKYQETLSVLEQFMLFSNDQTLFDEVLRSPSVKSAVRSGVIRSEEDLRKLQASTQEASATCVL